MSHEISSIKYRPDMNYSDTIGAEKMWSLQKDVRDKVVLIKANPLEAQISLFNLILVAGTKEKKQTKENRHRKRNKPCHQSI